MAEFGDRLRTRADVQFFVNAPDVGVQRAAADLQRIHDFLVEIAARQQFQHLALALWRLAGLTLDATGNLYGTTYAGGARSDGVVFQLAPGSNGKWTETILHTFNAGNGHDGAAPAAPIVIDSNGNLFGTATAGGKDRFYGIVFELTLNSLGKWQEKILHSFTDGPDGGEPNAGLTFDPSGNFYGTGASGGHEGVVFKETLGTNGKWKYKVVYAFTGGNDGSGPYAGLILDAVGNLYGTTKQGGASNLGTVFLVKP